MSGRVTVAGASGLLSDDADLTFSVDTLTTTKLVGSTSITDTGLTSGRVTLAGASGLLSDDADLTFATDTLTATKAVVTTSATINADGVIAIGTNGGSISQQTAGTPDQSGLWTGTTNNSWIIAEVADNGFDFAHAAATDPTLFIHSHNQNTTQWFSFAHDGTDIILNSGGGGWNIKTGGTSRAFIGPNIGVRGDAAIGFAASSLTSTLETFIMRQAPGVIQQGIDAGTATAQTYKGPDSTTSGVAGPTFTVAAGDGTVGNANGGDLILSGGAKAGSGVVGNVLASTPVQMTATPLADPVTANACSYGGTGFVCEGSSADANETTFTVVNPTADTTWQIPAFTAATYNLAGSAGALTSTRVPFANSTGALVDDSAMTFATPTLTVTNVVGPTNVCGAGALDATTSVCLGANQIRFEGTTADTSEIFLNVGEPSGADTTWTFDTTSITLNMIGSQGSQTATRVAFIESSHAIASDADFTFVTDTATITKIIATTTATINLDGAIAIGTNGGTIAQRSIGTPDQSGFWTGSTSNAWIIAEVADNSFDFAHAAQTTPTLFIHSNNQNTTQWLGLTHDGTDGVLTVGTGAIQQGVDAGTATAQTYKGPDSTTSGVAGAKLTLAGGNGTVGNANGGDLVLSGGSKAGTGVVGDLDHNAAWIKNQQGFVALNADYTNATASFTSTALSISVVSGQVYSVEATILLADSLAADGAKLDFNGGSATATQFRVHCKLSDTTVTVVNSAQVTALATAFSAATLTGDAVWECRGTFVPSSTGTFIVRGSQNAHTTGTLTFYRGSWLSLTNSRAL
jgi:hypothetical protein